MAVIFNDQELSLFVHVVDVLILLNAIDQPQTTWLALKLAIIIKIICPRTKTLKERHRQWSNCAFSIRIFSTHSRLLDDQPPTTAASNVSACDEEQKSSPFHWPTFSSRSLPERVSIDLAKDTLRLPLLPLLRRCWLLIILSYFSLCSHIIKMCQSRWKGIDKLIEPIKGSGISGQFRALYPFPEPDTRKGVPLFPVPPPLWTINLIKLNERNGERSRGLVPFSVSPQTAGISSWRGGNEIIFKFNAMHLHWPPLNDNNVQNGQLWGINRL